MSRLLSYGCIKLPRNATFVLAAIAVAKLLVHLYAGAIDLFGQKYGLPKAISGHQNYFLWDHAITRAKA